jgi:hypothetical protein
VQFQTHHVHITHIEVRVNFSIHARASFQAGEMVTIYEVGTFPVLHYAQIDAVKKMCGGPSRYWVSCSFILLHADFNYGTEPFIQYTEVLRNAVCSEPS